MAERYQGGTAPRRIEWIAETEEGVTPADPAWNPMSGNVETSFDGEPDAGTEARRGLGTVDPVGFFNGPETHEFDFVYDLNQWFVDGAGATVDPSNDAIQPAADNSLAATHTVVEREWHADGGADGGGRRLYVVGKGGHPASVEVPLEVEDGLPVAVTLSYQFEKVRLYDVSQPAAETELVVESTDADDTAQDVTIEDEGAGKTDTVTLTGTSIQSTSATFTNIDAIELSAETEGDVIVSINDGTSTSPVKGTELATIAGQNSYEQGEGDLGIPTLGAGSHAAALDPKADAIVFNDDTLTKQSGHGFTEITSSSFTVDLGIESNARDGTPRQNIHMVSRTTTLSASLAGEKVSYDLSSEHLQGVESDAIWTADEGTVTFQTGRIMSSGSIESAAENAKKIQDAEIECLGIGITAAA